MMEWARDSLDRVAQTRETRLRENFPELSESEAETLLRKFHPDYTGRERPVRVGPQAGALQCPPELADLLEADSPVPEGFVPRPDLETDVLILGGGGAGVAAALALQDSGLRVHLATKLRVGDANTVMAEGGIQAALGPGDSPRRHFADAYVGGHGRNRPDLLRVLVEEGGGAIDWLRRLGVLFDVQPDGAFRLRPGGGTSVPRVLACRDYTGLEIMRVLKDAVTAGPTGFLERHAAVELCDDGAGRVTGAVLWNLDTRALVTVSARAVLLATGGSGQLRLQSFPTSNHLGATGDGLVLAWRQGCRLLHLDSFQYHPSGASFPEALAGQLVTESIRSTGAQLLNRLGRRFVAELSYRDVVAAAILREVQEGRGVETPAGRQGVWLDTPMIDRLQGEGTLARQFPGLVHRFKRYDIHPEREPVLVYPTLHYQNGGVEIDAEGRTGRPGLWAAGEVTGGLHGTNRLMGNSLLDIIVFGRRAAQSIAADLPARGAVTLSALQAFRRQRQAAGELPARTAPQLFPAVSGLVPDWAGPLRSSGASAADAARRGADRSFEPPDPFARS